MAKLDRMEWHPTDLPVKPSFCLPMMSTVSRMWCIISSDFRSFIWDPIIMVFTGSSIVAPGYERIRRVMEPQARTGQRVEPFACMVMV